MPRHVTHQASRSLRPRPLSAPLRTFRHILLSALATLVVVAVSSIAAPAAATESANARFVAAGYQELLGRAADIGGLDFHVSRLAAGGDRTREAFTYTLLFSVEGSRQEVARAYAGLLGRSADPAGEAHWTNHLQGHGVLDLRVLLMSSQEYWNGSGDSDRDWLEALYQDILDRASDEGGRQYWMELIESGVERPLIVAGLYLSDESLGRRVDSYYDEILHRAPTAAERSEAINVIRTGDERDLRARLWASDEAFEQYLQAALS